jgi:hypothetical protein
MVLVPLFARQTPTLRPPTPVEPIPAIIEALRTHRVVALSAGAGHDDARGPDFVVSLIRDSRFVTAAHDLVVEGANAHFQDVMDRYVSGAAVPDAQIRPVWDDTTQQQFPGPIWTGDVPPIYRAVRDVNASLPRERHLRILLGDPPIDWASVRTRADFQQWLAQRDTFPMELLRREVLTQNRRAVLLFGSGHLQRRNQAANYQMDEPLAQTVVSLLEGAGTQAFVVRTAGDSRTPAEGFSMTSWPVPSLAIVRGTTLGASDEPSSQMPRMMIRESQLVPVPRQEWLAVPLEEQMDAILYLGPASTVRTVPIPSTVCTDRAYIEVRLQRMTVAGLPKPVIDHLKTFCGL